MDINAIIDHLGGGASVQALLGVGASAVSNYRNRGSFPEKARIKIWQALKARGIHVDPETLELIGGPTTESSSLSGHGSKPPSILLIIGGGIAAYKMLYAIRRMKDRGWSVRVIITKSGTEFITPLSVSALSGEKVFCDLFSLTDEAEMGHIRLARDADLVIVAPATANIIARMAQGMGDDLATTAILATDAPILIAPAMNPFMWSNPATEDNVLTLRKRGLRFIGPGHGDTACGEGGAGRMAEPEEILATAEQMLSGKTSLKGKRIVMTCGPTHEAIDGVRYIANRSSGKQGFAIAGVLAHMGADVHVISGPVEIPPPAGVAITRVISAQEMLEATLKALPADVAICTAAVADWAVERQESGKIKKTQGSPPQFKFIENPDILASISTGSQRPRLVIGFAAEVENAVANGDDKRRRKGCDWILANEVNTDNPVFGADDNQVSLITPQGAVTWPRMSKHEVAEHLTDAIIKELTHG